MILFQLLDQDSRLVDDCAIVFGTDDFTEVRQIVEPVFGHLRQFGLKLRLRYL